MVIIKDTPYKYVGHAVEHEGEIWICYGATRPLSAFNYSKIHTESSMYIVHKLITMP